MPFRPCISICALALALLAGPVQALEHVSLVVAGNDTNLQERLRNASLVRALRPADDPPPADILAAAQADYARLLAVLYDDGRYGGGVRILVDGREAASIALFDAPSRIDRVVVRVDPGPIFRLRDPAIGPLAPGTQLPPEFADGQVARAEYLRDAVRSAIEAWREAGHAKANVAGQSLLADHAARRLSARITLAPGPRLRFGRLNLTTPSAVRPQAIRRIAGLPTGEVFSPAGAEAAATRLRRTGAFSAVALSEAAAPRDGDLLDFDLSVADLPPRRFGFGAELSSLEGLTLSGFWLHRNILGGAERLRFDARLANVTNEGGGRDYAVSARLDVPAAFGTDIGAYAEGAVEYLNEPEYSLRQAQFAIGVTRIVSEALDGEIALSWRRSLTSDDLGTRSFVLAGLPARATMDRRDDQLNPAAGYFLSVDAEPFYDLGNRGGGLWAKADARAYRRLDAGGRAVLAGRVQLGQTFAARGQPIHPDFQFFSGGPGTVRGQRYKSLGIDAGGGKVIGGRAFAGASAELRVDVTQAIGLVGFYDVGHVGARGLLDAGGAWHAGAGVGLRYQTGLGPLRLDLAVPLGEGAGGGAQIYLGIGQAF